MLLEDFAACAGVMIAVGGLGLTAVTGNVMYVVCHLSHGAAATPCSPCVCLYSYDSLASIAIGTMLGVVAVVLVRKNQRFLIGHAVESEIVNGIQEIILSRPAVESVYEVQSQWLGPTTFTYKVAALWGVLGWRPLCVCTVVILTAWGAGHGAGGSGL